MLRIVRNIVIIIALVLGVTFAFFNVQPITVDLLFTQSRVPLIVVLLVDFLIGLGVAMLWLFARLLTLRSKLARTRRELEETRTEVRNLRSMPIHDA